MNHLTDTLAGGRKILVVFDDASQKEIHVRQIPVREYAKAILLFENEIALNALASGLTIDEVGSLQPESYELLHATVQEVNVKGFFAYAARETERNMAVFNRLPQQAQKEALARVASTTSSQSPASQQRRT